VIKIEFMMSTWAINELKMLKDNNEKCGEKEKNGKRKVKEK